MKISSLKFTLLMAIYFAFVLNFPIWVQLYDIVHQMDAVRVGFVISFPFFLVSFLNIIFTFFSIKTIEKIVFPIFILVSSTVSYASYYYGIIYDREMITNIFQTHYGESLGYVNKTAFIWVFFQGILPAILICKTKIIHFKFLKDFCSKLISILLSLVIIILIALFYYKDYVYLLRQNSNIKKMVIPTYFTYSAVKLLKLTYFSAPVAYKSLGEDAKDNASLLPGKNNLLVLVVGEAARSMNYQLNGYARATNPYTENLGVISFKNVTSCGTSTAVSVPCMFSNLSRSEYSFEVADHQDNLLDILHHAGVHLLWVDNDAGCKGVCKNIPTINIMPKKGKWCDGASCLDEIFLEDLQSHINQLTGKNAVIVLHIMGSHGPAYFERYPKQFQAFSPDCVRSDIQNCSNQELLNSYDNTILYTDYILSKTIEILKDNEKNWNASLIYLSDHGQSLGEKGLFLHGSPYLVAPREQIEVPLITWFSEASIQHKKMDLQCLLSKAKNGIFSHENLFHSVLGIMDISTNEYKEKLDIFKDCRK